MIATLLKVDGLYIKEVKVEEILTKIYLKEFGEISTQHDYDQVIEMYDEANSYETTFQVYMTNGNRVTIDPDIVVGILEYQEWQKEDG